MCNQDKSTEPIFEEHKKGKKRKYQQRLIDVEMEKWDRLTPLPSPPLPVFWHVRRNGEKKCNLFLSKLADKVSRKNGESCASHILA